MRLWASHNTKLIMKKGGSKDIGAFSKIAAKEYRKIGSEEKEKWERRAAEHNQDKDGQCYLYVPCLCHRNTVLRLNPTKESDRIHGGAGGLPG